MICCQIESEVECAFIAKTKMPIHDNTIVLW